MEAGWIAIWIITGFLAGAGLVCIIKVLSLHFCARADDMNDKLDSRIDSLEQVAQQIETKIDELTEKKKRTGDDGGISDIDWCIDDNRWRLQDIQWQICDCGWEKDDRIHQKRTSKETLWTAAGASLFALAGLVLSFGAIVIEG